MRKRPEGDSGDGGRQDGVEDEGETEEWKMEVE